MDAVIEVNDLWFEYPGEAPVLRGAAFKVMPGEKVALVGPNGAGKSTLLLHLNGILNGRGQINICGQALAKETLHSIRASVGLVFQSPDDQLFSSSVFDDVAFGPIYQGLNEVEVKQRVQEALSAVQLPGFAGRMPYHLSMGEKKRVALAAVLAMQPAVLVLDEPSAGLDPRARRDLIHLLRQLPQSLLIATHDLDLVRKLAERVLVMNGGRVVANGRVEDILCEENLEAYGL